MPTLYELKGDWLELYARLDDPDADEQAVFDTLEGIEGELTDKAEGYAKVIRQLESDAAAAKAEADRLRQRGITAKNKAAVLKDRLAEAMHATGQSRIQTPLFTIAFQRNPVRVVVDDLNAVLACPEYIKPREPAEGDVDKAKLKEALQTGATVAGAHIEQGESLRIR